MGKRTLHGHSYYQCDHTGLPLRDATCYLPLVDKTTGRVQKKGHYANWESVMLTILRKNDWPDPEAADRARMHVKSEAHGQMPMAMLADERQLEHFGGPLTPTEWHKHCCKSVWVSGVLLNPGALPETAIVQSDGEQGLAAAQSFGAEECISVDVQVDSSTRLHIHFKEAADAKKNEIASKLAGRDVFGAALVTKSKEEKCFMQRWRFVDMSIEDVSPTEPHTPTRKRAKNSAPRPPIPDGDAPSLTNYLKTKAAMSDTFKAFEANLSKDAMRPDTLRCGTTMPSPTGAELAEIAYRRACGEFA